MKYRIVLTLYIVLVQNFRRVLNEMGPGRTSRVSSDGISTALGVILSHHYIDLSTVSIYFKILTIFCPGTLYQMFTLSMRSRDTFTFDFVENLSKKHVENTQLCLI